MLGLGLPTVSAPLPQWLKEWEEKQRRQLLQHEEATREFVEVMRKELLDKLAQMEKSQATLKRPFVPAVLKAAPTEEEKERQPEAQQVLAAENPRSKFTTSLSVPSMRIPSSSSGVARLPPPKPTAKLGAMNDAMYRAIGGTKIGTSRSFEVNAGTDSYSITPGSSSLPWKPKYRWQASIYWLLSRHLFEVFSGTVIIMYTIAVGVMTDLDMRAALNGEESPKWRYYVDLSFTTVFTVEVLLRVLAEGTHFFHSKEKGWNVFDLLVALAGLLDIFAVFDVSLSFLRILRALRAVRVLRVIRIFRFFKELRLMIASILCCLVSLSWAFSLLISVMYIFAVVLLQGASDFLHTTPGVDLKLRDQLADDFGDMAKTIYALTQAVSGGRSWGEYAAPFISISPWYGVCFTLFVVFVIFGVLNILTGVFVESTSAVANFDKELVIQEEMSRNESVVSQIRNLFKEIDHDNSGTLTFKELKRNLSDERVKAYFSVLQMDVSEAAGLFELLDRDESGEVSIDEFIMTCMKLKGTARSIDLATMLFESKRLYTTIKTFMHHVDESITDVQAKLQLMQSWHEAALC